MNIASSRTDLASVLMASGPIRTIDYRRARYPHADTRKQAALYMAAARGFFESAECAAGLAAVDTIIRRGGIQWDGPTSPNSRTAENAALALRRAVGFLRDNSTDPLTRSLYKQWQSDALYAMRRLGESVASE